MLHLLSDNYLIPILLFLALAFDLTQVSLQDKHKITRECNDVKNPTVMCLIRTSLSFPSCCYFFKSHSQSPLLSSLMNPECQEKSWHSGFISYLLALCLCVQHACLSTHSLLTMAWLRCQWNRVRLPEPTAHTSEVKICKSLSDSPLTCKQN